MNTNKTKIYSRPVRLFLPIVLLAIAILTGTAYGCKETEAVSSDTEDGFGDHPRSVVPDELVGYWIAGVSSISNFWGYNGSYQGPANEIAVGYMLYKDGRAKEYFYYTSTSTYCRTQVLGYKEGTVKIDAAAKTLEMFYASGNYRSFNTCGSANPPGFGESKKYTTAELYPAKKMLMTGYHFKVVNGNQVLAVPIGNGEEQLYEKSTEPQK